ncbi:hypothetical protein pEaSNUABM20_00285 [Erwinia phage pEa_SNUABM_20]|nr:hypothetical protein pEaSNUABM20_00285 [Erwinia phage pEa_SNUABM_20]
MKQLFVGSHPNTVRFSDLDARDRVCEIRVLIANAYTILRDAIGEKAKDEANVFHGPWLVFRNLMNEHPASCLEEFRHASIYFDADTENMVTEIADLIEQHNELVRQDYERKGIHRHQADAMISIDDTIKNTAREVTMRVGAGKTRSVVGEIESNNPHLMLADNVRAYTQFAAKTTSVFAFCSRLTKKLGSDCYDRYDDMTQEEMIDCVHGLILASSKSVDQIQRHVRQCIEALSMPKCKADGDFDFKVGGCDNGTFDFRM